MLGLDGNKHNVDACLQSVSLLATSTLEMQLSPFPAYNLLTCPNTDKACPALNNGERLGQCNQPQPEFGAHMG